MPNLADSTASVDAQSAQPIRNASPQCFNPVFDLPSLMSTKLCILGLTCPWSSGCAVDQHSCSPLSTFTECVSLLWFEDSCMVLVGKISVPWLHTHHFHPELELEQC